MRTKQCENFCIFNTGAVSDKVFALVVRPIYPYLRFLKVAIRQEKQLIKRLPPLLKLELRTHFKFLKERMERFQQLHVILLDIHLLSFCRGMRFIIKHLYRFR
uniref:Uncharacterized protein n=1 Tax=Plectus sambesii TaxID=2011161 RepID=A0A914WJ05_9BILA